MSDSRDGDGDGDDAGYGKPPRRTRFKKNQSGNPRGRPPKKREPEPFEGDVTPVMNALLNEMARKVTIRENGTPIDITAVEAVFRRVHLDAIGGKSSAQRLIMAHFQSAEQFRLDAFDRDVKFVRDYKNAWNSVFDEAKSAGLPPPECLPNPKHLNFDIGKGRMVLTGPITAEEKAGWDQLKTMLHKCDVAIADATVQVSKNPHAKFYGMTLKRLRKLMAELEKQVPDGWDCREEL